MAHILSSYILVLVIRTLETRRTRCIFTTVHRIILHILSGWTVNACDRGDGGCIRPSITEQTSSLPRFFRVRVHRIGRIIFIALITRSLAHKVLVPPRTAVRTLGTTSRRPHRAHRTILTLQSEFGVSARVAVDTLASVFVGVIAGSTVVARTLSLTRLGFTRGTIITP